MSCFAGPERLAQLCDELACAGVVGTKHKRALGVKKRPSVLARNHRERPRKIQVRAYIVWSRRKRSLEEHEGTRRRLRGVRAQVPNCPRMVPQRPRPSGLERERLLEQALGLVEEAPIRVSVGKRRKTTDG